MTNKELRRLSRRDLLELLINQTKELNQTKRELDDARNALEDRRILLADTGSIAEATLKLNRVFEAAQEAADQYLENIRQIHEENNFMQLLAMDSALSDEQDPLSKVRQECAALRAQTEAECAAMREAARRECESLLASQAAGRCTSVEE